MSFHWIERMIVTTTGKDKEEEWPWRRNLGTNLRDSEAESKGEEKPVLSKTKAPRLAKANFPSDTTAHYLLLNSLLFKPTLRLSNQPFFLCSNLMWKVSPTDNHWISQRTSTEATEKSLLSQSQTKPLPTYQEQQCLEVYEKSHLYHLVIVSEHHGQ